MYCLCHEIGLIWKKSHFLEKKIHFLGFTVGDGEIPPGYGKIKADKHFDIPKNVKAMQSFLCLTGFFRKFINRYAQIARPLTKLLKKDTVFKVKTEELS